ncbi:ATP-binding protein [soil metagenome]
MSEPAPRSWSLKRRLAVRLSLLAVIAILGPLAFTLMQTRGQIANLNEMVLQQQATAVADAVLSPSGSVRPVPPEMVAAYRKVGDRNLFVVRDAYGRVVASSSPVADRVLHGAERDTGKRFLVTPIGGGSWLAYARRQDGYQIIVAQDLTQDDVLADSIAWDFAEASLWLTLPLLLTVLGVVYLTLTVMFRRVDRVAAAAAALTPGEQAESLPVDGLPREVVSLVSAVNLALARLAQAYDTEKRFTADAAHELRTPLAVLTARVEALKSGEDRDVLRRDVDRINRVVEQLLQAARLDARPVDAEVVIDLRSVLVDTVAEVAPLAVRQGREITLDIAGDRPIMVRGDATSLAVIVANLVDNALRHTASGPVEIVAGQDGAFSVLDRGQGIPDDEKRLLFERFQRGRRPIGSGSGLGLAIVRQIAEQLGGTVGLTDRLGGGSELRVQLRLAGAGR